MEGIQQHQARQLQISAPAFAAKFKSKREIYVLLTVEARKYLPPVDTVTIYFLKDCISGERQRKYHLQFFNFLSSVIKCSQIQHLYVPQYETLSLPILVDWARGQQVPFLHYLPFEREICKLPKQWVVNVLYTVIGEAFRAFVKEKIEERNARVIVERDLMINVDQDIANAFQASTVVSCKYSQLCSIFFIHS